MTTTSEEARLATVTDIYWQTHGWLIALITQATVIGLAFAFQLLRPTAVPTLPGAPWNWVVVGVPILLAIAAGAIWRRAAWLRWVSGVPFAVVSLGLAAVMAAAATFVSPRHFADAGIRAWFTTVPFVAAMLLVLLNLATVTGRRLATPKRGAVGFALNHLGLLLLVYAVMAGAPQYRNPMLLLMPGEPASQAQDERGALHDIGAQVTLNRFEVEYFPPHLVGLDFSGGMQRHSIDRDTDWATVGRVFAVYGRTVEVLEYLPSAMPTDEAQEHWQAHQDGVPAVKVRVSSPSGERATTWLAAVPRFFVPLDDAHLIGLEEALPNAAPRPKAYRSYLTITEPDRAPYAWTLEVNKPVRVGAWRLYQSSYQGTEHGYASVLQAVNDPALPLAYTGLACALLGAFVALWLTPPRRREVTAAEVAVPEDAGAPREEVQP